MRASRRVTLRSIATSLGVSVNTVSRALAGKDQVSEETRALVRAEAERLGYVPNSMARSLVLGAAMTLGMVITNPSNPFYARLISAVEQRSRAQGYSLLLMVTEENVETERDATESLLRWGVDGAIGVPVQAGADHWRRLHDSGVPLVLVNRDLPELGCDFVGTDYEGSAHRAAAHLLSAGAERVYLMEEDLDISSVSDRVDGFRHALVERGITVDDDTVLRVPTRRRQASALPWEPTDAYHLAQQLVARIDPGTAIMVGNDYFGLGVYRAVAEAGMAIPADVEVVGYGDHPFSAYLNPPLTSVRLPAADIGATAVDLMLRRLAGNDAGDEPEKVRLQPELVVRGSTR